MDMNYYTGLVKRLKEETYWWGGDKPCSHDIHPVICSEAAKAIIDLYIENETLEQKANRLKEKYIVSMMTSPVQQDEHIKVQIDGEELSIGEMCNRIQSLGEKVKILKSERDKAINDLRTCSIEATLECQYCKYRNSKSFCSNCTDGSNWTWR